jgi:hypothetical protein
MIAGVSRTTLWEAEQNLGSTRLTCMKLLVGLNKAWPHTSKPLTSELITYSTPRLPKTKIKHTSTSISLPSAKIIPKQYKKAITFRQSELGALTLEPDRSGPLDAEQDEIYQRMRRQLRAFLQEVPSQERGQVTEEIDDLLRQPLNWHEVHYKKVLWLCGNVLRNILGQHDLVSQDQEPHYAKLPPGVSERLRRLVESWNILVLGDPTLRELDSQRLGPRERQEAIDQIAAAKPIVDVATANRGITTEEASNAIRATLVAANKSTTNIHTSQAQALARGTSQNLIIQILRSAHRLAHDLLDPESDEARSFAKEYKSGAYKKMGEWTVTGVAVGGVSAALLAYYQAGPFFEFVITYSEPLKAYLGDAFQNPQLLQIVDSIAVIRERVLGESDVQRKLRDRDSRRVES